jgi:hypothetical protein
LAPAALRDPSQLVCPRYFAFGSGIKLPDEIRRICDVAEIPRVLAARPEQVQWMRLGKWVNFEWENKKKAALAPSYVVVCRTSQITVLPTWNIGTKVAEAP